MLSKLDRVFSLAAKHYAVSFRLWLYTAPFFVIGLVFTELSGVWSSVEVGPVLQAGVVAHLAVGVVFWVGSKTVLRPSRRESAGWKEVLSVYVVAGIVRGVSIGLVIEALGVGQTQFATRIITGIVLVVFSLTFGAYSAQLWREYRAKRLKLLTSIAVGERTDALRAIASGEFRPLALGDLEADVLEAREQTKATLKTIRDRIQAEDVDPIFIKQVFDASDGNWRELSHKAWIASLPNVPRITFLELIRTLASSRPISLIVLSSGPVYGFTRVFSNLSFSEALWAGFLWWLGITAIAVVTNLLAAKTRAAGVYVLVAGFSSIQFFAALIGQVFIDGAASQSEIWYVSLVSSTVAFAFGLPPALERSGQVVLDELERRLDSTAIENLKAQGEMFVLAQRIGSYLHSEVRGDFLRHSLALREALEKGDSRLAEQILDQLDNLVGAINLEESEHSPLENLNTFLDNWSGLIRIQHNLNGVTIQEPYQRNVPAIVMEAVNNAVRHGNASWVRIQVSEGSNNLVLQIDSNSEPFTEIPEQGLGTKSLDRLAPGSWSWEFIEGEEANSFLRLRVSLTVQGA